MTTKEWLYRQAAQSGMKIISIEPCIECRVDVDDMIVVGEFSYNTTLACTACGAENHVISRAMTKAELKLVGLGNSLGNSRRNT